MSIMGYLKLVYFGFCLLVANSGTVQADLPDQALAKAEVVVNLITVDPGNYETLQEGFKRFMTTGVETLQIPTTKKNLFLEAAKKAFSEITPATLKSITIKAYAETFSVKELNSMIVFYSSDEGKSILRKQQNLHEVEAKLKRKLFEEILESTKRNVEDEVSKSNE